MWWWIAAANAVVAAWAYLDGSQLTAGVLVVSGLKSLECALASEDGGAACSH